MQNVTRFCTLKRGHDGKHSFERRISGRLGKGMKASWDAARARGDFEGKTDFELMEDGEDDRA